MSNIDETIQSTIDKNDVVVFMKGTPEQPMCGFSDTAVQILQSYGVEVEGKDVLQDPELRQGIKDFSDWPTIPQVYISGEFVGGSDILREMHQNGELKEKLSELAPS